MNSMPRKKRSNRPLQTVRHRNQSRLQHRRQLLLRQRRREQNLLSNEPELLPPISLLLPEETP